MKYMNVIVDSQGNSGTYDLNSLKNEGNIYIMDNHMAASWCWCQEIDLEQSYKLLHIDKHYDLLEGGIERNIKAIKDVNFNIQTSTIEEYCSLNYPKKYDEEKNQIFRFDNYLTILNRLYPNLLNRNIFATHKDGTVPNDWHLYEPQITELCTDNIEYWISENESNCIVNIDIDYFFTKNSEDDYFQFTTDQFIVQIAKQLAATQSRIAVFTIALSPNFCGGIENSIRIANLILKEFNLKY